ncbi:MAG: hypothetical protein ABW352_04515, partial [Polyangiales bacterium]
MRNALCLLVALVACANEDTGPYGLRRDSDAIVDPGEAYRACTRDADCLLVNVTCNGCCARAAIAATLNERFDEEKEAACDGYRGAICDCDFAKIAPACVANVC